MKIYFAAKLTGASDEDYAVYGWLIDLLKKKGNVLTEIFSQTPEERNEGKPPDEQIHDKDMAWLTEADVIVAEVTQASLGVGYEIGRAREMGKRILCIFNPKRCSHLSPMINGAAKGTSFVVNRYTTEAEAADSFNKFFTTST